MAASERLMSKRSRGLAMTEKMTKGERTELGQLIRKREKVLKTGAAERSAAMMAEFDRQLAAIYSYDDDEIWKRATDMAKAAVDKAQQEVMERCRDLGIPPEFAPGLSMSWHGRGQNALSERRAELRRMAKSKIELIEKEAITKIEKMSLAAQTEVIANGLQSDAAKAFLEAMPPIETLMPSVDATEVKQLVEAKRAKQRANWYGEPDCTAIN
jgi:hypothetical protein